MKRAFPFLFNYIFVFISFLLFSCGKPLPALKNVDLKTWAQDKNACNGQRVEMLEAISSQKDAFLGLSESQIIELLNRPDHNELYKRNQKFYYYFLQPSKECPTGVNEPLQLVIRFNAMGIAKEASVEP